MIAIPFSLSFSIIIITNYKQPLTDSTPVSFTSPCCGLTAIAVVQRLQTQIDSSDGHDVRRDFDRPNTFAVRFRLSSVHFGRMHGQIHVWFTLVQYGVC